MDWTRPTEATCANCGHTFKVDPKGRVPLFCRPACRSIHFDKNKRDVRPTAEERQRRLIWSVLQDAGLIPADKPLPPRREAAA
jgi:hypothetical protein